MKVAIVQEQVETGRGGAETSTVEMARHLAALGLDVYVVYAGGSGAPFVQDNVTFLPLVITGATRSWRTYRFVQAAQHFCRLEHFDVVHAITPCLAATVYQPRGGTYAETVARTLARTPMGLRVFKWLGRRFNVRQRFLLRVERLLLSKRRVFVAALSEYVRRQVLAEKGFPPERVRVVFNGVDVTPLPEGEAAQQRVTLRTALGLTEDVPLALFVAHNFKLKGLSELLRALATMGDEPGLHVAVVGRDDPRPYEALARRLGVAGRVRFAGAQSPMLAWYAAADVLAHPTWYDPCSRVVLEALAVGLPVVTTRYNGAAEVMDAGRHGVVVDEPGDAAGLAEALRTALTPELRAACQADAGRMREQLSMARHARELKTLYEDILAGNVSD